MHMRKQNTHLSALNLFPLSRQYIFTLHHNSNITAVTGVGSSPDLATCETSQVLLAGVSGVFSGGSPVFGPPTDWPVSYELK